LRDGSRPSRTSAQGPMALPMVTETTSTRSGDDVAAFERLKPQLLDLWRNLEGDPARAHTSIVVPSLSVNQEELAKVPGAAFYEERLLFTLMRLRSPGARLIYLTSQPIHPETVDYYLQLLVGVPASRAKQRLLLLCVQDDSSRPLTEKILERPKVIERLRGWIGNPRDAYITCFNSTVLERRLALALGVPLYATDPKLNWLGTKSGCRKTFREAGVALAEGFEDLRGENDIIEALVALRERCLDLTTAVVKLNDGFSGEGNAIFRYPANGALDKPALRHALHELEWSHEDETYAAFIRKFGEMGGIVEEFVQGRDTRSPSAQMRILPDGGVRLVSTHDQVVGGATGQVYLGCRFPAHPEYRELVQSEAHKIGDILSDYGVVGRFGIDFLVFRDANDEWQCRAVEINLRMGGTTPPFMALELLGRGSFDPDRGGYISAGGREKFYYAKDNLRSPAYRGLLPEDLIDILTTYGIRFDPATETGVLFYMIGALSQYGKLGIVSIGNSRDEADELYQRTVAILDKESGADAAAGGDLHPLFVHGPASIE
jgi:PGM1 C-terminal domain